MVIALLIAAAAAFGIYALRVKDSYDRLDEEYDRFCGEFTVTATAGIPTDDIYVAETGDVSGQDPFPVDVDFGELLALYPNVVGWIYSEDTSINYPIVKGADNEFYLIHGIGGEYNTYGAIFADACNTGTFQEANTILYGHHMQNGSMFASIAGYKTQDYYSQHPVMWLATPAGNYRVDIYSCYVTEPESEAYRLNFVDVDDYASWISGTISRSLISAEVSPDITSRILTLSTCSYEFDNARCVVHGILVPSMGRF